MSQFLLKKGSSGSLHTFENNEYSYKINIESINTTNAVKQNQSNNQNNAASSDMGQYENDNVGANEQSGNYQYQISQNSIGPNADKGTGQKRTTYPMNNLFKEVIVEDEAEENNVNRDRSRQSSHYNSRLSGANTQSQTKK